MPIKESNTERERESSRPMFDFHSVQQLHWENISQRLLKMTLMPHSRREIKNTQDIICCALSQNESTLWTKPEGTGFVQNAAPCK